MPNRSQVSRSHQPADGQIPETEFDRSRLVGLHDHAQPSVPGHGEQVVNDIEARRTLGVVNTADIHDLGKAMCVTQRCEQGNRRVAGDDGDQFPTIAARAQHAGKGRNDVEFGIGRRHSLVGFISHGESSLSGGFSFATA